MLIFYPMSMENWLVASSVVVELADVQSIPTGNIHVRVSARYKGTYLHRVCGLSPTPAFSIVTT